MAEETFSQRYATGDSNTAGAFGFDLVSGVDYAISKVAFGDANTITRVTASVGLPVALLAGSAAIGKLAANDGVDIGDVTINNASGASAVNIQDGGNSITVDGTVSVTGVATAANQSTEIASLSSIDGKTPALGQALAAASVPVVLTAAQLTTLTPPAAITGFATESTLSTLNGKVTACNTGAVVISSALPAGTNNIGDVDVLTVPTDPFGANADAASATGSISAKLRFIASTGIPITGTVTVGSHAVTNAGTFVVQENGAALTSLQLIDDAVYTDGSGTPSKGLAVMGTDGTNPQIISTNATGHVNIADGGNSITVDNSGTFAVQAAQSGTWTVQPGNTANTTAWLVTGTGGTFPITDSGGSITVDNGGTFATQATLQAGTAYAGKVRLTDGTTDAEVIPLTNYNAQAVAIVDGSGNQITSFGGGTQYTEDVAAAANPVGTVPILVRSDAPGGISDTDGDNVAQRGTNYGAAYVTILNNAGTSVDFATESTLSTLNGKVTACNTGAVTISAALPAGTNAIGKLAANSGVDIGDIDVTSIIPGTGATNLGKAEDGAHTSGDVGVMMLAVQNAGPTNLAGSAGDYEPLQVSGGRLWASTVIDTALPAGTNLLGRISGSDETSTIYNGTTALTPKYAVIAASSSGNNTLVAAVTSKKIRVLAYNLIGNGAVNAKFQSGASGTDLTGLKYIAAAGGGISASYNPVGWFETGSGVLLNLNLSGAVAVGGELVYVEI